MSGRLGMTVRVASVNGSGRREEDPHEVHFQRLRKAQSDIENHLVWMDSSTFTHNCDVQSSAEWRRFGAILGLTHEPAGICGAVDADAENSPLRGQLDGERVQRIIVLQQGVVDGETAGV